MSERRFSLSSMLGFSWVLVVFGFLYLPIIIFFIFSFNQAPFPSPWVAFTFQWYKQLATSGDIWHALYNSLLVSISSVILSVVMGTFLIFFAIQGGRVEKLLGYFYANIVFPEIVLAVGLLGLFTYCSIPLGMVTLTIAHSILGLGYVIPLVYARYGELDYRLTEAALDLGATPIQTFFTIILPLLKPSLLVAAIFVFIISFDDFVLAYFCSGSGFQTLPLYILSMLRTGVSPIVNALSTVLLVFCSLLILVYSSLNRKAEVQ